MLALMHRVLFATVCYPMAVTSLLGMNNVVSQCSKHMILCLSMLPNHDVHVESEISGV